VNFIDAIVDTILGVCDTTPKAPPIKSRPWPTPPTQSPPVLRPGDSWTKLI
jgi:hypothetical protein